MSINKRALLTATGLAFTLTAATVLLATPAAQASDVEVTMPATLVIENSAYPDSADECVALGYIMWKDDPEADTTATVRYSFGPNDEQRSESSSEPFNDSDTWAGLSFRVPAGNHWIRVSRSWQSGGASKNNPGCSVFAARIPELYRGPFTVTYTVTKPDPAIITPLGRTVNLNKKHRAAVAVVACPWDGPGGCSVKLPSKTTVKVKGTKHRLSVVGKSTVPRGKSTNLYVKASKSVRKALDGRTIRPKVHITATKQGTKPTRRTANQRSIRIR